MYETEFSMQQRRFTNKTLIRCWPQDHRSTCQVFFESYGRESGKVIERQQRRRIENVPVVENNDGEEVGQGHT